VGRVNRFNTEGTFSASNFMQILRPDPAHDSEFVFHLLNHIYSIGGTEHLQKATTGIRNLDLKTYLATSVFLPPLDEQRHIAAVLKSIDDHIAASEDVVSATKAIKAATFSEFLRSGNAGESEPIENWNTGKIEGVSRLPVGWTVKRLVNIAQLESGHTPSRKHPEYWDDGKIDWLSLHDTQNLENIILKETAQKISKEGLKNSSARLLPAGTVCFSRTATVGKCVIMGVSMATSQDFANFICSEEINNRYLLYLLRWMQPVWSQLASGSTHKTIYMPTFESLQIVVPTRDAQNQIVSVMDALTESTNEAVAIVDACRRLKVHIARRLFSRQQIDDMRPTQEETTRKAVQPAFKRAVLAAEVVHQLHKDAKFGSVKHEKIVHICEHHADLHHDIDRHAYKKAAGPYDPKARRSVEANFKSHKWFDVKKAQSGRTEYVPMEKYGGHKEYFDRYFSAQRNTIQAIIDLLRPLDSQRCEIIATLYAVWNDYLLDGANPTDNQIVDGARNNWHASKQAIPEDRWAKALTWMREKHLVPKGTGEKTRVATA
jgi:type I restriction enzyme S subunit